jgi:hypothetical protein
MNNWLKYKDEFWKPIYLNRNKIEPQNLRGSVLYLGMGSSLIPRLQSENVTKTTIVEIDKGTIDFNINNHLLQNDWIIIEADAYTYEPNELYDFIFIDIFYHSTTKETMNGLIERYSKYLKECGEVFYLRSVVK